MRYQAAFRVRPAEPPILRDLIGNVGRNHDVWYAEDDERASTSRRNQCNAVHS
jgi:hypothetical protein